MPSDFKHLGKNWAIDADCEYIYVYDYKKCKYSLLSVGAIYVSDPFRAHVMYRIWKSKLHAEKKSNIQKRQSE